MSRLGVNKTYKLFIGGAFPRSESGRTFPVEQPDGTLVAHACLASRKDLRDAVSAARKAQSGWAGRTAYNRAQILYRIAEVMETRSDEFVDELDRVGVTQARAQVDAAIDRWVWYAGWADKYTQILGGANPVAGPYFNLSVLEPTGVVGVAADDTNPLVALVSRLAPVLVSGNTAIVIAPESAPLVGITLAETLATSDVPGGVVNILTGSRDELVPWLADHADVNAVDLSGCSTGLAATAREKAAATVTRTVTATTAERDWFSADAESPYLIEAFCETKTVWHPIGR
jgi:acyl-CoA reductase-like NAD-dependent aldehyde dehydrogenase